MLLFLAFSKHIHHENILRSNSQTAHQKWIQNWNYKVKTLQSVKRIVHPKMSHFTVINNCQCFNHVCIWIISSICEHSHTSPKLTIFILLLNAIIARRIFCKNCSFNRNKVELIKFLSWYDFYWTAAYNSHVLPKWSKCISTQNWYEEAKNIFDVSCGYCKIWQRKHCGSIQ